MYTCMHYLSHSILQAKVKSLPSASSVGLSAVGMPPSRFLSIEPGEDSTPNIWEAKMLESVVEVGTLLAYHGV